MFSYFIFSTSFCGVDSSNSGQLVDALISKLAPSICLVSHLSLITLLSCEDVHTTKALCARRV